MTMEELIEKRNAIQCAAEDVSDECGAKIWVELGVANRHIERLCIETVVLTPAVEREIVQCLDRAQVTVEQMR